ncbi:hypothetical protein NCCP691_38690 [Noviherbaspirillum aridicola]|uniref:Uncharacterized protein n=1 Tax=Noviherbaspirillum aridicola TaxID=2849687 RepID=A0ABQ4QAN4_9BURK|nr:hypothetical protein NCCP691_38690 [Noviherbaspirillum aridicola]
MPACIAAHKAREVRAMPGWRSIAWRSRGKARECCRIEKTAANELKFNQPEAGLLFVERKW